MRNIPHDALANQRFIKHFWADVDVRGEDECWPWLDLVNTDGYGLEWIEAKYTDTPGRYHAHRIAYTLVYGEILEETPIVLHICDNPPCCNPHHLRLGTNVDNVADREVKGRGGSRKRLGNNNGSRTHRETKPRGEDNWKTTLTEEQVVQLRQDSECGMSTKAIAKKYDISLSGVNHILYRRTWKHV